MRYKKEYVPPQHRTGAIVALVAVMLPVMLVLSAFVVNLAYVELTRTELRIATDAASRAAGHKLVVTGSKLDARAAAREAGNRNHVAGERLQFEDSDIIFGVASRPSANSRYTFTPGGIQPNSVQILGRRTATSDSGSVSLILPMSGQVSSFEPTQIATASQIEMDIVLVLDRSGSMAYGASEDFSAMAGSGQPPASAPAGWSYCDPVPSGSRWADLTVSVGVFITALQNSFGVERVGLVTYGATATIDVDMTTDYTAISQAIADQGQSFCNTATNIGGGMEKGIDAITDPFFSREGAAKVMVVLTDGRHNTGTEPLTPAHVAASEEITVYTITFSNDSEQQRMIDVADIGGGEHFHAPSSAELQAVFEEIARSLPTILTE